LGVLIGVGMASVLVVWTNEGVYMKDHSEIVKDKVHSHRSVFKAYGHVKTILFFIGYSRSRHTLLGSLLDAHPHMVIADETSAFGRWSSNPHKWINSSINKYYNTLFASSKRVVSKGRRSQVFKGSVSKATSKFRYYVPNQWQGTFEQYIEVIGDKSGAFTAFSMNRRNAVAPVQLLEETSGAKVKFVHVVRNPFDNIATMVLQHKDIKARYGDHEVKV